MLRDSSHGEFRIRFYDLASHGWQFEICGDRDLSRPQKCFPMRNQSEFVQLIDRYRLGEAKRLVLGIAFKPDFSAVGTSMLLTQGRGKCLRPIWIEYREALITPGVASACLRFSNGQVSDICELVQLRNDVSIQLAAAARRAMAISDSSEKKLLAICVDDPGIWLRDFDGVIGWEPLVSAATLSEQVGSCVIDGLPLRDVAGGGKGWPLEPLAWWLMFADRGRKIADTGRILVYWSDVCRFCWIPESDGIDNEIPAIRHAAVHGARLEAALLREMGIETIDPRERDRLGAQGKIHTSLHEILIKAIDIQSRNWHPLDRKNENEIVTTSLQIIREQRISVGDLLITLAESTASYLKFFIDLCRTQQARIEVVAGGSLDRHGLVSSAIGRIKGVAWSDPQDFNYQPACLESVSASMMGMMHIDQMPLTIPELTGSPIPRVAGRLTPGNLAGFRRLIMEMGDTSPPVMKLRDAV